MAVSMQASLEAPESQLRALIDSVRDHALLLLDPDGYVISWSVGALVMTGYAADDIIGQHFTCFFPAEDVVAGRPARELMVAAAEGRFEEEGWRVRKDGSRFWASVVISATRREDGELAGFAKLVRDISERRRMEDRFRQVVEAAPNAMVMINRQGVIEMVNAQTERVFGYQRDEMLGRSVEMLVPERFRGAHPGLRGAFFHDPLSRPMGAGRDLYALRKDGSEFPVEIGLNPIETEEGTMVLSAIVDISTRKRLEERFRQVVESAPNAMVMINHQGVIEMVNAQTERVFGYQRDEMLGRSVEMLVPERFRGAHPGLRAAFFDDPLSRPMGAGRDLYALRKDGSEFPVEIGLNPIETEEGTMVLSAVVDISDRKHREEGIRGALREKEVLLGEIHHRVKNNLQIVHSLLDLQSARISDPLVQEMLRDSQNRIRSMALIHQTLYSSKDFAKVDFDLFLDALAPNLIGSYGVDAERIRLAVDVVQVALPIDAAVPCGLVVNELISNALKHAFRPGQDGEITVSLKRHSINEVTLSVSDNGSGLPDGVDATNTATLGLQLVSLLTEQLGGVLTINRVNPTRFLLRFPIER
jgi:PAS domain S-box-containing protein